MSARRKLQEISHPLDYSLWVTLLLCGCVAAVAVPDYIGAGIEGLTKSATSLPGKAVEGLRSKLPGWLPGSTKATVKNPKLRAALDAIAWAEGTYHPNGYKMLFGENRRTAGSQVPVLGQHPNICVPFGKECSTAFGRYQFLNKTWWRLMGDKPMTPQNQDIAAIKLLKACGVVDDIIAGKDRWITNSCVGGTWASFPVNSYGQPQRSASALIGKWQQFQGN